MELKLKPVAEQVIVIAGASSGIGLVTAKMAARRGARVVLSARMRTRSTVEWLTSSAAAMAASVQPGPCGP